MPPMIREALPDDAPSIIALWHACNLVAPYNDPQTDFRFALEGPASTILIAEEAAGAIIGSIMVGHDGHRGWLYYVAVAPDAQRHGIGAALVAAGEAWLRDRKVPKVQLMVRQANEAVAAFYDHLGYEDMPRILMSKWLNDGE